MSNTLTQNPYVTRFENMLKPLQLQLAGLEKNLDSIEDDHQDKQNARLDVLTKISKIKQDIENAQKNLECSKEMSIIRSEKVPSNVADYNVWNDCWYDEERKFYVTYNKYFMKFDDAWARPHQKQYTKETGVKAVIILPEQIEFRFGYPAMLQKNSKNNDVWFLLPTINYDMMSKDIVSARLNSTSQEKAILYKTDEDAWIDILGTELTEKEYEIACEVIQYLVKTPLEVLKASAGRPYNKKLFEKQMTQINK